MLERRLLILLMWLMIIFNWCLRRDRGLWVWDWLVLYNNRRLQRSVVWVVTTSVVRLRRIKLLIRRYLHKSVTAGIEATSVSSREIWRVSHSTSVYETERR